MASSNNSLPLLTVAQEGKVLAINALALAASPAMLFGRDEIACVGLTVRLLGGRYNGQELAAQNVTLTDAATNYLEADAAGVVFCGVDGFAAGRLPLYTVTVAGGMQTAWEDYRQAIGAGGGGSAQQTSIPINAKTAAHQLSLADVGAVVRVDSAAPVSITVPANADEAIPTESVILVRQAGSGQVTIAAAAGVMINYADSLVTRKQHSEIKLHKVAADVWDLSGDTE